MQRTAPLAGLLTPGAAPARARRRRRLDRIISPVRNDAFALGDKTPDAAVRTYADVMREQQLARERDNTLKNISDKLVRVLLYTV